MSPGREVSHIPPWQQHCKHEMPFFMKKTYTNNKDNTHAH